MYLAGGIIFIVAALTVIGTLISDLLLAVVDPRIRLYARRLSVPTPKGAEAAVAEEAGTA